MDHTEAQSGAGVASFHDLGISKHILSTIDKLGYRTPTPIQTRAIPVGCTGRDLIGLAQTGTGKTVAFSVPMVERLMADKRRGTRALILAPTRELADQIHETVLALTEGTGLTSTVVYGGVSHNRQVDALARRPSIVVACPGRLLDHMSGRTVDLSAVEVLVLDEADRMFDMGFLPNVRRIVKELPKQRQTMLFSATMPDEIRALTRDMLVNPETVRVAIERPVALITHSMYAVERPGKRELLVKWLGENPDALVVVFTQMKHTAKNIAERLLKSGVRAASLHGNLSQNRRKEALEGFKTGRYNVLVATDIAARGIDVEGVTHVLNYDMPDTLENYIHRTGRAGRASRTGRAVSFIANEDRVLLRAIERFLGTPMDMLGTFVGSGAEPVVDRQPRAQGERRSDNGRGGRRGGTQPRQQGEGRGRRPFGGNRGGGNRERSNREGGNRDGARAPLRAFSS